MGRIRRLVKWGAALAAMAVAGLWLSAPDCRLVVRRCETGAGVLEIPARAGMDFSIRFHHSYDRAFFREHYHLAPNGRLVLSHMTFKSALNGQGFEMGTYRALPDGTAELADIKQPLEQIIFRLGSPDLANHTLILDQREVRLLDYAQPGDLLCITAVSQPRWKHWPGSAPVMLTRHAAYSWPRAKRRGANNTKCMANSKLNGRPYSEP
ncbi:MAG: DUF1850 domain-containing protein [Desulfatitalea sp.]|nr:DUF1850 domain-containing protein [Desulfatitalea sp.]